MEDYDIDTKAAPAGHFADRPAGADGGATPAHPLPIVSAFSSLRILAYADVSDPARDLRSAE